MTTLSLPGIPDETIVDVIPPGQLAHAGILQAVPVVEVRWYDERASCTLAHRYDACEVAGTQAEYGQCYFYTRGGCKVNGNLSRDACLFHLPETAPAWDRLRANVLLELPDGSTAITSRAYAPQIAAALGAVIVGAVRVKERR